MNVYYSEQSYPSQESGKIFSEFLIAHTRSTLSKILGVTGLLAMLACALSLATWSVNDPSWNHATEAPVQNWLGAGGAVLADLMIQIFGLACVFIVLPLAIWFARMAFGLPLEQKLKRIVAFVLGVAGCAMFFSAFPIPEVWPLFTGLGGVVGDRLLHVAQIPFSLFMNETLAILITSIIFAALSFAAISYASFVMFLNRSGTNSEEPKGVDEPYDWQMAMMDRDEEEDEAFELSAPNEGSVSLGALAHFWYSAVAKLKRSHEQKVRVNATEEVGPSPQKRDWKKLWNTTVKVSKFVSSPFRNYLQWREIPYSESNAAETTGVDAHSEPHFSMNAGARQMQSKLQNNVLGEGVSPTDNHGGMSGTQYAMSQGAPIQQTRPFDGNTHVPGSFSAPNQFSGNQPGPGQFGHEYGQSGMMTTGQNVMNVPGSQSSIQPPSWMRSPQASGTIPPAWQSQSGFPRMDGQQAGFPQGYVGMGGPHMPGFPMQGPGHAPQAGYPGGSHPQGFPHMPQGAQNFFPHQPEGQNMPIQGAGSMAVGLPRVGGQNGSAGQNFNALKPLQNNFVEEVVDNEIHDYPAPYELPNLDALQAPSNSFNPAQNEDWLERQKRQLEQVLNDFGVKGAIINARPGPVVTLFELQPAPGIKSSRVIGLSDDIARSMSAVSARVAVIPGRNVIGIELPNKKREVVFLRELLEAKDYSETRARLPMCLGKTIGGEPIIVDLARMPHLLIAGTTGSGKSVAINTMILSLLYRLEPSECRLIMIDPKMLELSVYDGIPHLLTPVVTDPRKAVLSLKWAVREMEERYRKMSKVGVRNIEGFNAKVRKAMSQGRTLTCTVQAGFQSDTGEAIFEQEKLALEPLPFIVVIVDEMADLMMVAGKEIEGAVQRLAQMARAAGIHIIMATQRPSVDVITGTIKANFPTRISFQVTSRIDSRTILGEGGAEQLLGQGDMLYMAGGGRIGRIHGPFVSDEEVEEVVHHLKQQGTPEYLDCVTEEKEESGYDTDVSSFPTQAEVTGGGDEGDLYQQAVAIVLRDKKASTSYVQRRLSIGYNRAASLIERMEKEGIITPPNHAGRREIMRPVNEPFSGDENEGQD